jgi:hypothetical protein
MNKLLPSIRITRPAFIEGRVIGAFALQFIGVRHLFPGYSTTLFEATAPGRRRR